MTSTASTAQGGVPPKGGPFSGRRGRILKENLTAYLFLLPAMGLIFVFGLFPVAFSLYVSMYKWKIKQGALRGAGNYVKAMGNLAYVIAFFIAIGAIVLAVMWLIKVWKTAKAQGESPWLLVIPGGMLAFGLYYFLKFAVLVMPEIMKIGEKVQRVERTRELYTQLFGEAFRIEAVAQARQQMIWLVLGGIVLWVVINRFIRSKNNTQYLGWFFGAIFFGWVGYLVANFTYANIVAEYAKAADKGKEIAIWPQVISIMAGLLLLYLSWEVWNSASRRDSSWKTILSLFSGIALLIGAWILISEIPSILEQGDDALWSGLRVTAWFSLGTVPAQLAMGLGIAYLLYQEIKGKSFFRMIYFLPYITPAVASAAVFRIMFSNRPTGMMNKVVAFFGGEPLKWLLEPTPVFSIGALEGPSLALIVIMLFNIWTYTGYNAVIFLAGLGGIPRSLYEAAEIDGANRWEVFRNITLPLLSPITYFLSLLGVIGTFKAFNHIFILRNAAALRSVDTMSMVIWDLLKTDNRYGYAATMSFILFGVVLMLTVINNKIQGEKVFYG